MLSSGEQAKALEKDWQVLNKKKKMSSTPPQRSEGRTTLTGTTS